MRRVRLIRALQWFTPFAIAFACMTFSAAAQDAPGKKPVGQGGAKRDPAIVFTRIYRLSDLVVPAPNYSFEGIDIQGLFGNDKSGGMGAGGLSGMGGMGGGMGGMGGGSGGRGGFMNQPDDVQVDPAAAVLAQAGAEGGMYGASGMSGMPGMSSMMGSGYPGGMGVGMGTGIGSTDSASHRYTLHDVVMAIMTAIEPQSWREMGGPGSIVQLGGNLVVTQTAEVHQEVQDFIEILRQESGPVRTVTVRAYWLPVTGEIAEDLLAGGNGTQLDRETVAKLAGSAGAYHGQITCFDGQTVHIVSGRMKNFITSFIPVVGQTDAEEADLLGQTESKTPFRFVQLSGGGGGLGGGLGGVAGQGMEQFGSGDVGYQPVTTTMFSGALLQVTPTVTEDRRSIVLDLRSIVSEPSQTKDAVQFQKNMPIDRLSVAAQRLMTTLQVPLNEPTVVGGMGVQARNDGGAKEGAAAESDSLQIYLVVDVSLGGADKKAGNRQ